MASFTTEAPEVGFTDTRFVDVNVDKTAARAINLATDIADNVNVRNIERNVEEIGDTIISAGADEVGLSPTTAITREIEKDSEVFKTFKRQGAQLNRQDRADMAAEVELRKLFARYPGYRDEITAIANRKFGRNVQGSIFSTATANDTKVAETPLAKGLREIETVYKGAGKSQSEIDEAKAFLIDTHENQVRLDNATVKSKIAELDAGELQSKLRASNALGLAGLNAQIALDLEKTSDNSQFLTPEKISIYKNVIDQKLQDIDTELNKSSTYNALNIEQQNTIANGLKKQWSDFRETLNDKNATQILKDQASRISSGNSIYFAQTAPYFTAISNAYGTNAQLYLDSMEGDKLTVLYNKMFPELIGMDIPPAAQRVKVLARMKEDLTNIAKGNISRVDPDAVVNTATKIAEGTFKPDETKDSTSVFNNLLAEVERGEASAGLSLLATRSESVPIDTAPEINYVSNSVREVLGQAESISAYMRANKLTLKFAADNNQPIFTDITGTPVLIEDPAITSFTKKVKFLSKIADNGNLKATTNLSGSDLKNSIMDKIESEDTNFKKKEETEKSQFESMLKSQKESLYSELLLKHGGDMDKLKIDLGARKAIAPLSPKGNLGLIDSDPSTIEKDPIFLEVKKRFDSIQERRKAVPPLSGLFFDPNTQELVQIG